MLAITIDKILMFCVHKIHIKITISLKHYRWDRVMVNPTCINAACNTICLLNMYVTTCNDIISKQYHTNRGTTA